MKELNLELLERMGVLEKEEQTPITKARINELTLVIVRVQQILLKDFKSRSVN